MIVEFEEVRKERDRAVSRASESEVRVVELVAKSEVEKVDLVSCIAESPTKKSDPNNSELRWLGVVWV